jgi:hypothetical protein
VVTDIDRLKALGLTVVEAPLASKQQLVRHDADRAASIAVRLAGEGRSLKKVLGRHGNARAS